MLPLEFSDFDFDLEIIVPTWLDSPPAGEPDAAARPEAASPDEGRRLRRMVSNRESARRSRVRKRRHLEDLREQEVRLRAENRGLPGRLADVARRSLLVRRENRRLWAQSVLLRRRLEELRRRLRLVGCLQRRLAAAPAPSYLPAPSAVSAGGGALASCYWEQTLASLMA